MSAFVKASADALLKVPAVNGVIDGDEIIYRDYTDISIAVATPKGLVVPVLRNVDSLSFAEVEKVRLAQRHAHVVCREHLSYKPPHKLVWLTTLTCCFFEHPGCLARGTFRVASLSSLFICQTSSPLCSVLTTLIHAQDLKG